MRISLMMTALVATMALAGTVQAQDAAQDGQYRAALNRMIVSTADGECPADLMAEDLLAACNDQIYQIGPALQGLGPITEINFVRAEGEGEARVEVYDVIFEGGQMLTWGIGTLVDGKFQTAYVGG